MDTLFVCKVFTSFKGAPLRWNYRHRRKGSGNRTSGWYHLPGPRPWHSAKTFSNGLWRRHRDVDTYRNKSGGDWRVIFLLGWRSAHAVLGLMYRVSVDVLYLFLLSDSFLKTARQIYTLPGSQIASGPFRACHPRSRNGTRASRVGRFCIQRDGWNGRRDEMFFFLLPFETQFT